ncbi:MAG TPA: hypothetical protein VEF53_12885 [Patescibacteria group bacterium]|nr:hypothetical protein [Patescibacteria group bacterium]
MIEKGEYHEAIKAADDEYAKTSSNLSLRNKIFALLITKRFDDAIATCDYLISKESGESESDFKFKGTALWNQNKRQEAIDTWKSGVNSKFTDAAGGIEVPLLLYFAAVKTNNVLLKTEAVKSLKKVVKSSKSKNWPGPLGALILENVDENALLSYVSTQPSLRAKQLCQANFYIAIKNLENGNIDRARQLINDILYLGKPAMQKPEFYLCEALL